MDALAAAAVKRRQCNPPTLPPTSASSRKAPTSPSTPASRPSALSINFLVDESSSSPYFAEEDVDAGGNNKDYKQVVVDEQLRAPTPNKIVQQDEDDDDDRDNGDAASTTATAQRASPFYHLLHNHHQPRSVTSGLATPAAPVSPCVVLPRPVRPNSSSTAAMPAYPPLHGTRTSTSSSSSTTTTTTTTATTYPYPAFYPLASFASVAAGASPIDAATRSATATTSSPPASARTPLPPPVPVLTTPVATGAAVPQPQVIDLQLLSQLYLQASPYLLAGGLLPAATPASSATASMHQAVFAHQPGQPSPAGYLPFQLQQQVFQQAMALAHLHPMHQQQHQQTHLSPPPSTQQAGALSPRSSPAHSPIALARSIDRRSVPSQSHHSVPTSGSDRMSVLESILARAERQVHEDERGVKRERESSYADEEHDVDPYDSPSMRNKRRRTDSTGSDGEYSPYGASASSGASGSSDDEASMPRRNGLPKPRGLVGTGMKEMLYKRRQASPKQVVLLEQVFAVEPIPTSATKLRLSEVLNMSPKRVTVWFKNKRARQKKKGIPLPNSSSSSSSSLSSSPATTTTSPSVVTLPTTVQTSPIDRKFAAASSSPAPSQ